MKYYTTTPDGGISGLSEYSEEYDCWRGRLLGIGDDLVTFESAGLSTADLQVEFEKAVEDWKTTSSGCCAPSDVTFSDSCIVDSSVALIQDVDVKTVGLSLVVETVSEGRVNSTEVIITKEELSKATSLVQKEYMSCVALGLIKAKFKDPQALPDGFCVVGNEL